MRREGKRICESPTQKCFGLWPAIHRDSMVTDVDNAHGAGAGGSVGAGVGASDVGDVETGNGTAVTTMTTTMTLTARDDVDGDDNLNCRVTCLTSEDNNSAVIPITRNK